MIRVLIDRYYAEGMAEPLRQAELEARRRAMATPGYISGETLRDVDDPQHNLVISTWSSRQYWDAWRASDARKQVVQEMNNILVCPERITILEPL